MIRRRPRSRDPALLFEAVEITPPATAAERQAILRALAAALEEQRSRSTAPPWSRLTEPTPRGDAVGALTQWGATGRVRPRP